MQEEEEGTEKERQEVEQLDLEWRLNELRGDLGPSTEQTMSKMSRTPSKHTSMGRDRARGRNRRILSGARSSLGASGTQGAQNPVKFVQVTKGVDVQETTLMRAWGGSLATAG